MGLCVSKSHGKSPKCHRFFRGKSKRKQSTKKSTFSMTNAAYVDFEVPSRSLKLERHCRGRKVLYAEEKRGAACKRPNGLPDSEKPVSPRRSSSASKTPFSKDSTTEHVDFTRTYSAGPSKACNRDTNAYEKPRSSMEVRNLSGLEETQQESVQISSECAPCESNEEVQHSSQKEEAKLKCQAAQTDSLGKIPASKRVDEEPISSRFSALQYSRFSALKSVLGGENQSAKPFLPEARFSSVLSEYGGKNPQRRRSPGRRSPGRRSSPNRRSPGRRSSPNRRSPSRRGSHFGPSSETLASLLRKPSPNKAEWAFQNHQQSVQPPSFKSMNATNVGAKAEDRSALKEISSNFAKSSLHQRSRTLSKEKLPSDGLEAYSAPVKSYKPPMESVPKASAGTPQLVKGEPKSGSKRLRSPQNYSFLDEARENAPKIYSFVADSVVEAGTNLKEVHLSSSEISDKQIIELLSQDKHVLKESDKGVSEPSLLTTEAFLTSVIEQVECMPHHFGGTDSPPDAEVLELLERAPKKLKKMALKLALMIDLDNDAEDADDTVHKGMNGEFEADPLGFESKLEMKPRFKEETLPTNKKKVHWLSEKKAILYMDPGKHVISIIANEAKEDVTDLGDQIQKPYMNAKENASKMCKKTSEMETHKVSSKAQEQRLNRHVEEKDYDVLSDVDLSIEDLFLLSDDEDAVSVATNEDLVISAAPTEDHVEDFGSPDEVSPNFEFILSSTNQKSVPCTPMMPTGSPPRHRDRANSGSVNLSPEEIAEIWNAFEARQQE